jgi:two-component system sensor kinase FixL
MTVNAAETGPLGSWHSPVRGDAGLSLSRAKPAAVASSLPFPAPMADCDRAVSEFDEGLSARIEELQRYIDWQPSDQAALRRVHPLLRLDFPAIVEDFYQEISRHSQTRLVLGDNPQRPEILRRTLHSWLDDLFTGGHAEDYVQTRWRVGRRHVEIGLPQVYTSAALARLRQRLAESIDRRCVPSETGELHRALHRVIDLDHMIIQEAYRHEWVRRQAELERQQSLVEEQKTRQALAAILKAAPCLIVLVDSAGIILEFSPSAESLTGYLASEVVGRDWFEVFIPEPGAAARVRQELARALAAPFSTGYTNLIRVHDGSERLYVWNTCPLVNETGATVLLAVGQDITPLREAQQRALQTERLAAIGEMITGLAHESRNALQRSQACLEMLAMEVQDRPAALDLVARIQNAQDALHALYEEVRDYAAPIRLKPDLVNLRRLVEDTWENLAVERQRHPASLTIGAVEGIPRCRVDPLALERVFRNVLENSLTCGAVPVRIEVELTSATFHDRPAYRVTFRDNGPGMSAETRARVFEPFYTTKTKGTGLGMAISRRLVEAHGGRIEVGESSAPGAEIVITLPVDGPPGETVCTQV